MVEGYPKKDWGDIDEEDLKRIRKLRNDLLKWRLASRTTWQIPQVEIEAKGRLKELWKPILQVVADLPIQNELHKRLTSLRKSRIQDKQSTLEGHIVKVVLELFTNDKTEVPASHVWEALKADLKGVTDKTKDYKMHTAEFDEVTKNKVGRRLRAVLLAERGTYRVDKNTTVKAWVFKRKKLERVARKYGYYKDFMKRLDRFTEEEKPVTELPKLPISRGISVPKKPSEQDEKQQEKPTPIPSRNGNIGNTVTPLGVIEECTPLKEPHVDHCAHCGKIENLVKQIRNDEGQWGHVCKECGELFDGIVKKRREPKA